MTGIGAFKARRHKWHDELHARELEMLHPDTRGDAKRMRELLRDDFIEFGSSGRVYEKRMLVDMLSKEEHAAVTALVTYRSVGQSGQEARRSSIWVKEAGQWRMAFHQGTRIPNSWGAIS